MFSVWPPGAAANFVIALRSNHFLVGFVFQYALDGGSLALFTLLKAPSTTHFGLLAVILKTSVDF